MLKQKGKPTTGGYDYQFIDSPSDMFLCQICHLPSREPHLSVCCGHTFCKSCVDATRKFGYSGRKVCPMCRSNEFATFLNKQTERAIKSLRVFCSNKDKGCEWQGEINNKLVHSCQFDYVKCTNYCGKMLRRRYLEYHIKSNCPRRKVECKYCYITGEIQLIEGQHKEKCPKMPLPCPNNCNAQDLLREDIANHRKACPCEGICCTNQCGKTVQRHNLSCHIQNECPHRKVDCQYCHITGEHQYIEHLHKGICPKFPLPCSNQCDIGKICREDMETHRSECALEIIRCEYHSIGCEDKIPRRDQEKHEKEKMKYHLFLTKCELTRTKVELHEQTAALSSKLENRIKELENQLEKKAGILEDVVFKRKHSFRWSNTLESNYNSMCRLRHAQIFQHENSSVIVKVPDYSKWKADNINWSSVFYRIRSLPYSAMFKLLVFPAGFGNGKGTHLSVKIEFTALSVIVSPFYNFGNFQVKLLNRISDTDHHTAQTGNVSTNNFATIPGCEIGEKYVWSSPWFVSNEVLYKPTATRWYLKDDYIYLQISNYS